MAATVTLPPAGRTGRPPKCPLDLAQPGTAWWRWAWRTPQATRWDKGALFAVARRAELEDVVAAMGFEGTLNLGDVLAGAEPQAIARVHDALELLRREATGALSVKREMRALDKALGLNPEGMAALGWVIAVEQATEKDALDELTKRRAARAGGAAT